MPVIYHEEHSAIEDVFLFLHDFLSCKAGKIYDRMDQPTFFEMFEVYRSARVKTYMHFKEERDAQFKVMGGITNRSFDDQVRDREKHTRAISEFLYNNEMKKEYGG